METPQQEYGTVGPQLVVWQKRPCYILGGGPSLLPWQSKLWDLHQKGNVICVNDSYKRMNSPDLIVTLDHLWLEKNIEQIKWMSAPVIAAVDESNPRIPSSNLTYLKRLHRSGMNVEARFSDNPGELINGMNSGHAALQVAYLKGAKLIYLLGFDFKEIADKTHFHAGYPWHNRDNSKRLYPVWAEAFKYTLPQLKMAAVEVFNCSGDSLLTVFPFKAYSEVL